MAIAVVGDGSRTVSGETVQYLLPYSKESVPAPCLLQSPRRRGSRPILGNRPSCTESGAETRPFGSSWQSQPSAAAPVATWGWPHKLVAVWLERLTDPNKQTNDKPRLAVAGHPEQSSGPGPFCAKMALLGGFAHFTYGVAGCLLRGIMNRPTTSQGWP